MPFPLFLLKDPEYDGLSWSDLAMVPKGCFGLTFSTLLWLLGSWTVSAQNPSVVIDTSMGRIVVELYPDRAPETVNNFLEYVRAGHYDGTIFHRVVPYFVVQGGGFTPALKEKPNRKQPFGIMARSLQLRPSYSGSFRSKEGEGRWMSGFVLPA